MPYAAASGSDGAAPPLATTPPDATAASPAAPTLPDAPDADDADDVVEVEPAKATRVTMAMVGYDKNVPNHDGLLKLHKVLDPVVRSGMVSACVRVRGRWWRRRRAGT